MASTLQGLEKCPEVPWRINDLLTGTIPSELGKPPYLKATEIWLGGNALSGTLPDLPKLKDLRRLSVPGGQVASRGFDKDLPRLTGTIPQWLSSLKKLTRLDLSGNRFRGTIPSEFSELTALKYLDLSSNFNLNGALPTELSELTSLEVFDVGHNQFTGLFPEWVCTENVTRLSIDTNGFMGTLPLALTKLQSVTLLEISGNKLQGKIPPLRSLGKVTSLHLQSNRLTGAVPSQFPENLIELNLNDNMLSGNLPFLQLEAAMISMSIKNNRLYGHVPIWPPHYQSSLGFTRDCMGVSKPGVHIVNVTTTTSSGSSTTQLATVGRLISTDNKMWKCNTTSGGHGADKQKVRERCTTCRPYVKSDASCNTCLATRPTCWKPACTQPGRCPGVCGEGFCCKKGEREYGCDGVVGNSTRQYNCVAPPEPSYVAPQTCPSGMQSGPGYDTNIVGGTSFLQNCRPCNAGFYCVGGLPKGAGDGGDAYPVPAGTYSSIGAAKPEPCPVGHFCLLHCSEPTACPHGKFRKDVGGSSEESCDKCRMGMYNNATGASRCIDCPEGFSSKMGSTAKSDCVKRVVVTPRTVIARLSPDAPSSTQKVTVINTGTQAFNFSFVQKSAVQSWAESLGCVVGCSGTDGVEAGGLIEIGVRITFTEALANASEHAVNFTLKGGSHGLGSTCAGLHGFGSDCAGPHGHGNACSAIVCGVRLGSNCAGSHGFGNTGAVLCSVGGTCGPSKMS